LRNYLTKFMTDSAGGARTGALSAAQHQLQMRHNRGRANASLSYSGNCSTSFARA